jgi:hypothetical protein
MYSEVNNEMSIDTDVKNLSSVKLGYIIRLNTRFNVLVDKSFIDEVTEELVNRGHYKPELERRLPH